MVSLKDKEKHYLISDYIKCTKGIRSVEAVVVLRKALYRRNASFHSAEVESLSLSTADFCVSIQLHGSTGHLPSRSISNTLMASCVLSGRTSLAGSVCLLWIPGETEGGGCISLMKGCAPATDIIRPVHSLSPPK